MAPIQEPENAAVVIMAGGSGTRLWPLSRKSDPKQFHAFLGEKTLLEETYDRVRRVVPKERIFVSTVAHYRERILEILPDIQEDRLLLEPVLRNTGPAIGLVATLIRKRLPGAVVATVASDHAIENEDAFVDALRYCLRTVSKHPDRLGAVGINPTKPDTGLGYIRIGGPASEAEGEYQSFFVDSFKEKPDRKTAEEYLEDFRYLWNASYFVFSADSMLGWIETHAPKLRDILRRIDEGTPIEQTYEEAENEPIDTMLVEKLPPESRIVVPAPIRWSDIGTWNSLYEFLSQRQHTDTVAFGNTVVLEGKGNLVYGGKKRIIALLGVEDLVVVDTDDALFITKRNRAPDVKTLIEKLRENGREELL